MMFSSTPWRIKLRRFFGKWMTDYESPDLSSNAVCSGSRPMN